jgi:hypothetical protein
MGMSTDLSSEIEAIMRSQMKAWKSELERLSRDPRVRRFSELRQKLDEIDTVIAEASGPPIRRQSHPFDPYDAFEFARDLAGRVVSTLELSKLAYGRFPEMSRESRQLLMHFLIDNGAAEVVRKTATGRPTWYQFGPPMRGGIIDATNGFGSPGRGLSRLKREDLEEVTVRVLPGSKSA